MISDKDVETYNKRGYLVVPNVLTDAEVAELRQVTEEFVEKSRAVSEHTDIFDLEPGHTKDSPKVRRIKTPHAWHPVYERMVKHPKILAVLQKLWGPSIRFDVSKLNHKSAGFGSPIEWHQDWAFYPHTNDDVLATGIYLDDCDLDNGPLMVVPGSHRGPTFDHHSGGRFCGAMDPAACGIDFAKAVPLTGPAGSMTIHHARLVHGSALTHSNRQRRLLLHEYTAADAWPLMGVANFDEFNSRMVLGEPTIEPRVVPAPVRMPLPPAPYQGSIYENQTTARNKYFKRREVV